MDNLDLILKRHITNLHKQLFGRGPRTTYVKILRNSVVVKHEDCLTPMEKRLCCPTVHEGVIQVEAVRTEIVKAQSQEIERLLGVKVRDAFVKVYPLQDAVYCFFITTTHNFNFHVEHVADEVY